MTNRKNNVLYTGVTSDIFQRCTDHRDKRYPDSFSARCNLNKLVYYEEFRDINAAIER